MKIYKFDLEPNIINYSSSLRKKTDIIKILVEVLRFLNISKPQQSYNLSEIIEEGKVRLVIYIDKMSRICIIENNKIHSFSFPFRLKIENDKYILSFNDIIINNAVCSILSAIFNEVCDCESVEKIVEKYWDIAEDLSVPNEHITLYAQLITHLLSFEPGYLRFDHDEYRADEKFHPQNHIDFNYSPEVTYKLGLEKKIDLTQMIDIININTTCTYLK